MMKHCNDLNEATYAEKQLFRHLCRRVQDRVEVRECAWMI